MTRIPLSVPEIGGNEWAYVKECLDTGWVSSAGPFVDRFEREFAAKLGVKHAVACS
ncbi:MAG: DegT/DnrJ/EryC1/StrS family aminotransferase, partial [Armatimonadetes bacterium]|nr:DegT/DnrJ/EryC1/StrS family aminotransferase [Armatimonadota bacterium]